MPETHPAAPSIATKNAGERAVSNHYHRQILRALEAGDGERAEIIMREHVYEGRDFVIGALEEEMR